ncbi:hypothetical protein CYMTET_25518 [Cymbomonas tetramitiformis]|uniref:Uncharacterized protein n=1 Tax=Cymbomonas tetramitiformis TaxID=36881 RepID=A0AAE0FUD6_9CHLO|nr:hypothetical protein CYMTET_25518 [Cymbomonas tetramitiformis]
MNFSAREIVFSHTALPKGEVRVYQDVSSKTREDVLDKVADATACYVWDAAPRMARWLCSNPQMVAGKSIVELGAGVGLPGIVSAQIGAKSVTLTDKPNELRLLRENSSAAGVDCMVKPCTWADKDDMAALGTFDVVLCSDLLYDVDAQDAQVALCDTIKGLCREGGTVYLVYHFRENMALLMPFMEGMSARFDSTAHDSEALDIDSEYWLMEYSCKGLV